MTRKTPFEATMARIQKEIKNREQHAYDSGYRRGLTEGVKAAHEQIVAIAPSPTLPLVEVEVDLSSSISILGLSNRAFNTLERQKITTIAKLTQFSASDLLDAVSMGKVSIKDIDDRLAGVGLRLPKKSAFTDRYVPNSASMSQKSHTKLPVTAEIHKLGLSPEAQTYLIGSGYYTVGNVIDYLRSESNRGKRWLYDRLYLDEIKHRMAIHGHVI